MINGCLLLCIITTKSKLEQQNIQHSCFEYSILLGGEKKLGEQVNKKLLYRESDLLDVGMVVQKARKQGTVLLQWGFIGFYN